MSQQNTCSTGSAPSVSLGFCRKHCQPLKILCYCWLRWVVSSGTSILASINVSLSVTRAEELYCSCAEFTGLCRAVASESGERSTGMKSDTQWQVLRSSNAEPKLNLILAFLSTICGKRHRFLCSALHTRASWSLKMPSR